MDSRSMRVVHVSPTDIDGGAARGAYNLHSALRAASVDSRMLVQRKYSDDPSVLTMSKGRGVWNDGIRARLDRLPLRFYPQHAEDWWTVGWLPFDIVPNLRQMAPDLVQFHWTGRGAAPGEVLNRLTKEGYPIVWTLRDMWPLTGGCHYSNGCEKFLTKCGPCPQLGSRMSYDMSRWLWRHKHRAWRNAKVTYVALSHWMADYARRSPLTFDNEVAVIPNGIDTERYRPADKNFARAIWSLPQDKRIILFGALNATTDRRKGFSYLKEALKMLADSDWKNRAIAVIFGGGEKGEDIGLPTRYIGRLHDDVSLSLLYATADVMVVPSVQENFGKTSLEALACGVPVVSFANTGQIDIVDHKINGYLAENLSPKDLATGIAWCLDRMGTGDDLSRQARNKAARCFDIRRIAHRHVDLYDRLLRQKESAKESGLAMDSLKPMKLS